MIRQLPLTMESSALSALDVRERGIQFVRSGEVESAIDLFEAALKHHPGELDLLTLLAECYLQIDQFAMAASYYRQACQLDPTNGESWSGFGIALMELEQWHPATNAFQQSLQFAPSNHRSMLHLGFCLFHLERPAEAIAPLNRCLQSDDAVLRAKAAGLLGNCFIKLNRPIAGQVFHTLHRFSKELPIPDIEPETSSLLFIDPNAARLAWEKQRKIAINSTTKRPQLCFYIGEPGHYDPTTLIALPVHEEALIHYFTQTRLELPKGIIFNPANLHHQQEAIRLATILESAKDQMVESAQTLYGQCRHLQPTYTPGEPLRIFLNASRSHPSEHATISSLAKALKQQGQEVFISVEQDEREERTQHQLVMLREHQNFNPHVTFSVNQLNNRWLADAVVNLIWWQENRLEQPHAAVHSWRENDINLSPYRLMDSILHAYGADKVERQAYCIDPAVFQQTRPWEARTKVIFIGSAYAPSIEGHSEHDAAILEILRAHFEAGQPLTRQMCITLADRHEVPRHHVSHHLANAVLRDQSVMWLCQMAPELKREQGYEVEIYGRGWAENPTVQPYYRGELPQGEATAQVYNSARYALSASHGTIRCQRLMELAACGATPLVYDARSETDAPHWENHLLFYRSREALRHALTRKPKADPREIAQDASYDRLAQRVIQLAKKQLSQ
uniref:Spore protein YkvP/CgeB glycosyl transferase-like domain-containing protein n=1 Tax=Magnetococcus massalia (strain MO-1) TaxID=451514 RepID=A0A1S7LJ17_MAGMO|nr:Protein of unknown function [Candidatus Magnetococcus massalia]